VFNEFGVIIVGLSAEYDSALRNAVERSPSRRFATYWINPGEPTEHTRRVIAHCEAVVVTATADDFLGALADAHQSLVDLARRAHPLDIRADVETAKRQFPVGGLPAG
jgi:hypothetical protein